MISCRPYYLQRGISSIFLVAVYLPPQTDAGTMTALNQFYKAISKLENAHPEAALLVAGDFNAGKLKSVLPNFYQHVTCATKGRKKTLDHHYSTHRDAYKALPGPPFGKSDHNYILLIPAYKQKQSRKYQWLAQYGSGQMTQMLCYRTVLLAQTGICSGIHSMALRSIPSQSSALSISASTTSSPWWTYVHIQTRSHGLQATSA